MYIPPEWKRRALVALLAVIALAPGWRGELVPVDHDAVILDASGYAADDVIPASREGEIEGEAWHLQYLGSGWAHFFDLVNLRGLASRLVPPSYVAHIPPGMDDRAQRADGYFRVETHWRWPWWWPGGGVDWRMPG